LISTYWTDVYDDVRFELEFRTVFQINSEGSACLFPELYNGASTNRIPMLMI